MPRATLLPRAAPNASTRPSAMAAMITTRATGGNDKSQQEIGHDQPEQNRG